MVVLVAAVALGLASNSAGRTDRGRAHSAQSTTEIRYYKLNSKKFKRIFAAGIKKCLGDALALNPYFNHDINPSGKNSNKFLTGRVTYPAGGTQSKVNLHFRKGYKLCFMYSDTSKSFQFVPPKRDVVVEGQRVTYLDPTPRFDKNGKWIAAVYIWAMKK